MGKDELRKILIEYADYEKELTENEVADGAPRPVAPRFSFARFFNWINELEQP